MSKIGANHGGLWRWFSGKIPDWDMLAFREVYHAFGCYWMLVKWLDQQTDSRIASCLCLHTYNCHLNHSNQSCFYRERYLDRIVKLEGETANQPLTNNNFNIFKQILGRKVWIVGIFLLDSCPDLAPLRLCEQHQRVSSSRFGRHVRQRPEHHDVLPRNNPKRWVVRGVFGAMFFNKNKKFGLCIYCFLNIDPETWWVLHDFSRRVWVPRHPVTGLN